MTQNHQLPEPELEIRNQGLAVFAAIQLNQTPDVRLDNQDRVVFAFQTQLSFSQLNLQYKNSVLWRAHELHHSLSGVRKQLLNNSQHKD